MVKYVTTIDNFWSKDLAEHKYVREVPFVARNFSHLDKEYYSTGHLLQSFNEELKNPEEFKKVLTVENASVSWTCILPNVILPTHYDTFYTTRQLYNVDVEQCYRYLVFLEDWVFGQLVGFKETNITNWKSGDVWYLDSTEFHFAVNASNQPFNSCQVSTFK